MNLRLKSQLLVIILSTLTTAASSGAELYPFGRLFTDNSERRVLDAKKRNAERAPELRQEESLDLVQIDPDQPVPTTVKFSGYVKRGDGKYAVWINGKSELSMNPTQGISVTLSKTQSSAQFNSTNATTTLTPGQIWYPEEGVVKEHYLEPPAVSAPDPTLTSDSTTSGQDKKGKNRDKPADKNGANGVDAINDIILNKAIKTINDAAPNLPVALPNSPSEVPEQKQTP